jgi:hypothetical protein
MSNLDNFLQYYEKAKKMQELKFENVKWNESDVNDDLIWNVPIYDVVNRRYAAFSSLLEAIKKGENDPKGNGIYFNRDCVKMQDYDFIKLCYLFRLCGSGINYKPKKENEKPFGTHGFGNFWVVEELRRGFDLYDDWVLQSVLPENKFCDVKGYLLPMIKGGLRNFIIKESKELTDYIVDFIYKNKGLGIKEIVDKGNEWLTFKGYKRQNFVLTAFAMDLAEYFPDIVDRNSDVYVGSNAKKCLKLILPNLKENNALRYLCDVTGGFSKPYDMEDVACDFIRYLDNFQSEYHIKLNNGIKYYNNVCK